MFGGRPVGGNAVCFPGQALHAGARSDVVGPRAKRAPLHEHTTVPSTSLPRPRSACPLTHRHSNSHRGARGDTNRHRVSNPVGACLIIARRRADQLCCDPRPRGRAGSGRPPATVAWVRSRSRAAGTPPSSPKRGQNRAGATSSPPRLSRSRPALLRPRPIALDRAHPGLPLCLVPLRERVSEGLDHVEPLQRLAGVSPRSRGVRPAEGPSRLLLRAYPLRCSARHAGARSRAGVGPVPGCESRPIAQEHHRPADRLCPNEPSAPSGQRPAGIADRLQPRPPQRGAAVMSGLRSDHHLPSQQRTHRRTRARVPNDNSISRLFLARGSGRSTEPVSMPTTPGEIRVLHGTGFRLLADEPGEEARSVGSVSACAEYSSSFVARRPPQTPPLCLAPIGSAACETAAVVCRITAQLAVQFALELL
jgi:hypothetical protein